MMIDRFSDNNGLGMDEELTDTLADCKRCDGCGEVFAFDHWGEMDYITCPDCRGTGEQKNNESDGGQAL